MALKQLRPLDMRLQALEGKAQPLLWPAGKKLVYF
jgi:hypothetical protein